MIFFVANENNSYRVVKLFTVELHYDPPTTIEPMDIVFAPRSVQSFAGAGFYDLPDRIRNAINNGYLKCYRAEAFDQYAPTPTWDVDKLMPVLDQLFKAGVLHALITYVSDRQDAEASAHQCIYCQKGLAEHANSQCLFGSTKYFSWAAAFQLIKENPNLLRPR